MTHQLHLTFNAAFDFESGGIQTCHACSITRGVNIHCIAPAVLSYVAFPSFFWDIPYWRLRTSTRKLLSLLLGLLSCMGASSFLPFRYVTYSAAAAATWLVGRCATKCMSRKKETRMRAERR
jgi:hypothetical protein